MHIEVDHCPTSKRKHYFISVSLNKKESISFDHTIKGVRVIKQELVGIENSKKLQIAGEWDTIILKDRKFINKYHVKWVDQGEIDIINGEVWKTVWEKKISGDLDESLLFYSRLVSDNYEDLDQFGKELRAFEDLLSKEIYKYE